MASRMLRRDAEFSLQPVERSPVGMRDLDLKAAAIIAAAQVPQQPQSGDLCTRISSAAAASPNAASAAASPDRMIPATGAACIPGPEV